MGSRSGHRRLAAFGSKPAWPHGSLGKPQSRHRRPGRDRGAVPAPRRDAPCVAAPLCSGASPSACVPGSAASRNCPAFLADGFEIGNPLKQAQHETDQFVLGKPFKRRAIHPIVESRSPPSVNILCRSPARPTTPAGHLSQVRNYKRGLSFFPLVRERTALKCALKIAFLRTEEPGRIYQGGDIDNRLKTLLDALSVPQHDEQVVGNLSPIYCLLEDDSLITRLEIQTHRLLGKPNATKHDVHLLIEVDVRVT